MLRRTARLTVLCIAVAYAAATHANGVLIEKLTSPEVRALVQSGHTTVLIPIGGTEQNGPHMVLGKHNVRVKALCEKIADRLGNALVAPVIAYVPEGGVDPPSSHMRFAGTISITPQTFERLLEDAARSFRATGFRDIVFVGDHGGYQRALQAVAARLDSAWAKSPARAHALVDYYSAVETDYPAALAARGYGKAEIGTHAGLADTALALAIDPALVRQDILASGRHLDAQDGVYGDPRRSTAALGQIAVDAIVARSVEAIRRVTRR